MEQLSRIIEGFARSDWIATAITAVVILAATAVCARIARRFMRRLLHFNEGKDLPSSSIFVNIVRGAVWFLGACIMLSTCFNVNVSAAITALGIGGIAVSLGFQDTISNLIGGLQVSLMRIVKPGDNIEVGSSSGVVKDVTWRHTSIRNSAGEEVIIPNSIINKTALVHLPPTNQVKLPIVVVTDGERLDEVAAAIERSAAEAASTCAKLTKQPALTFTGIGDAGFQASLAFTVADSRTGSRAGDAVLRAIAPLTRAGGVPLAERVLDEAAHEATEREKGEGEQQHDVARSKPKAKSASRRAGGRSNVRNRVAHALRAMKGEGR